MGDSRALLGRALEDFPGRVLAVSRVWRTAPWGGVPQEDFLNVTALVEFPGTPRQLLAACQELERAAHRTRELRWGPRTLDVDIIDIVGVTSEDPELMVPHPRAHLRAFVLRPWLDIDPHATLGGVAVAELVANLGDDEENHATPDTALGAGPQEAQS
ncbi:2-amino-4-hydroxy-6-hydroxymethyldihydropteridine diphosphokinase [Corynebacterium sp. 13CS0277]|nr:2-amino-4-hydroxy-6-hydroxymethyldihydropteridine diphosphokinase [Corynebacterium sp. 13CS0277]PRQ11555.1 2-amino-4-hydroxy-6-hydroxymethyldihydropteridine diphosphokinase [Corynebacterium sp. 13CS0277]